MRLMKRMMDVLEARARMMSMMMRMMLMRRKRMRHQDHHHLSILDLGKTFRRKKTKKTNPNNFKKKKFIDFSQLEALSDS